MKIQRTDPSVQQWEWENHTWKGRSCFLTPLLYSSLAKLPKALCTCLWNIEYFSSPLWRKWSSNSLHGSGFLRKVFSEGHIPLVPGLVSSRSSFGSISVCMGAVGDHFALSSQVYCPAEWEGWCRALSGSEAGEYTLENGQGPCGGGRKRAMWFIYDAELFQLSRALKDCSALTCGGWKAVSVLLS